MTTAKETLLEIANTATFGGRTARKEAVRRTLNEVAGLAGELPLSMSDASLALTMIAGAYIGVIATSTEETKPALLGRVRTVGEMVRPTEGYGGWDEPLSVLERCEAAWTAIAKGCEARGDGRSQAIAATWHREASFLRAAMEIEDS